MIVTLSLGETQTFHMQGARFYFVDGSEKIRAKLIAGGDSRSFDLYPRQGINSPDRFHAVELTNLGTADQDIEFEVSDREVFDNRIPELTTIVPDGGVMPVEIISPLPLPVFQAGSEYLRADGQLFVADDGATAHKILDYDAYRVKTAVLFERTDLALSDVVYIGGDSLVDVASGYPIDLGADYIHESKSELWVIFGSAGDYRVKSLDETNGA